MPILVEDAIIDIEQSRPESMLTLDIDYKKQQKYILYIAISNNDSSTGVVKIYAKMPKSRMYGKIREVDLSTIADVDVTDYGLPFESIKIVPVGVVGSFDVSYCGY